MNKLSTLTVGSKVSITTIHHGFGQARIANRIVEVTKISKTFITVSDSLRTNNRFRVSDGRRVGATKFDREFLEVADAAFFQEKSERDSARLEEAAVKTLGSALSRRFERIAKQPAARSRAIELMMELAMELNIEVEEDVTIALRRAGKIQ